MRLKRDSVTIPLDDQSLPVSISDRPGLHPIKLTFADETHERRYQSETLDTHLVLWRWLHIVALVLFDVFATMHAALSPQHASLCLSIAFGVITPMFLVGFASSYSRHVRLWWQAANALYVIVTGLGALVMVVALGPELRYFSLTGFIFCYMFGFTLIRLRFPLASVVGMALTVTFIGTCYFIFRGETVLLTLGVLYVVGFNVLGMVVAYVLEMSDRRNFFARTKLERQRERIEGVNERLEDEVSSRTEALTAANAELKAEIHKVQALSAERDRYQERFLQSQKLETVGRLAGGIAHDFNNLLTIINSFAEFADEGLSEADPLKSDLRQIKDAGKRASDLTRQLLAFSRKQVLEPQILDLNAVVSGLESMVGRLIGEDIELHTVLARQIGMVCADPGQLEQVLMNLAVNARDAMPDGGKLTIETANVNLDDEYASAHADTEARPFVMLALTDTGEGMSAEVREQVFEPFFTTKEKGRGTGLGLATVYGIVKQSGGNIWVYSEPDQGTTFKVYLPRVEDAGVETAPEPAQVRELQGSETVLVVEDEPTIRELASRIVKSAGYRPIVAANGGEALLECERHAGEVQLVLTDVVMPKMSGRELAERLKKISPGLRVLYMSGYTDNAIDHHGVLDAGTHFIAKPFNSVSLLRKMREVLDA